MADTLPDNPLPACPDTPSCVRTTKLFDLPSRDLFRLAQAAVRRMSPYGLNLDRPDLRLHAVFRVLFVFKDDVHVTVNAHKSGSALHIRSASRVGKYDFGVNRRRVTHFFDLLDEQVGASSEMKDGE